MSGCSSGRDPSWQNRYSEAREKYRSGYTDTALQLADTGYHEAEGKDQIWSWRFRILLAQIRLRQGAPDQAMTLLRSEPPANSPGDVYVRRKIFQAYALCQLSKLREAEGILAQAELLPKSNEAALRAEIALTRGLCVMFLDPAAAKQHFSQAEAFAHGSDPFIEAVAVSDIGYLLFKAADYDAAIQRFNQVMTLTDSPLLRERALGNTAESYAELGDWRQSIAFAEQAEKLAGEIKNTREQEVWLIDLGRAHFVLTEFPEAERYYSQAHAIARRLNDTDKMWRCLNHLTELALKRHDLKTAEQYWKEESALNLGSEARAYATVDAAEIAIERKDFAKAEQLFKEVLQSKPKDSVRLTVERELGNVYWRENKIIEADRAFLRAIKDVEDTISKLPLQFRMSFLDEDPFYDSYVRFLVAQGRKFEALKIAERGRAQILSQATSYSQGGLSPFSLETVQSALKRRTLTALAYSLTNDESFLWVLTPTLLKVVHLPSHKALRTLPFFSVARPESSVPKLISSPAILA